MPGFAMPYRLRTALGARFVTRTLPVHLRCSSRLPSIALRPLGTTPQPPAPADVSTISPSIPGAEYGGRKLVIIFTCTVCETRSAKKFTKNAYDNGVVVVQCPGCQNYHLIADRLGFFEDGGWDIRKVLEDRGESVTEITDDDNIAAHLTPERLQELIVGTTCTEKTLKGPGS